jgi:PKD repeat protein
MPQANFVIWDSAQCFEDNAFGFQNQSNISSGSLSFCWEFGDNDTSCDINPVHSYSYADTFIVTLVAKSDNDCYDTTSATTYLHVNPEPVADFIINDSTQCLRGNDFDFTNLSTIKSGSFSSYWYYGDGYSENVFDTNYSYSNHDTYSVILLVISDKGCKDSIVKTNIVYPMPLTDFSIDNNQPVFIRKPVFIF